MLRQVAIRNKKGSGINNGDVIEAFKSGGFRAGGIEIVNLTSSVAILAFGNDETTSAKDGFEAG